MTASEITRRSLGRPLTDGEAEEYRRKVAAAEMHKQEICEWARAEVQREKKRSSAGAAVWFHRGAIIGQVLSAGLAIAGGVAASGKHLSPLGLLAMAGGTAILTAVFMLAELHFRRAP